MRKRHKNIARHRLPDICWTGWSGAGPVNYGSAAADVSLSHRIEKFSNPDGLQQAIEDLDAMITKRWPDGGRGHVLVDDLLEAIAGMMTTHILFGAFMRCEAPGGTMRFTVACALSHGEPWARRLAWPTNPACWGLE